MDAAATVMGPRPGLVILKFWQGVVEIVFRVIAIVSSTGMPRYFGWITEGYSIILYYRSVVLLH